MNLSRILGALSLVTTVLTAAAAMLQFIRPSWAVYALALTGAINAFTERVQGSKAKDAQDEGMRYPPKE